MRKLTEAEQLTDRTRLPNLVMTPLGESTGPAKAKSSPATNPGVSGGGITDLLLDIVQLFLSFSHFRFLGNWEFNFLLLLVNLS